MAYGKVVPTNLCINLCPKLSNDVDTIIFSIFCQKNNLLVYINSVNIKQRPSHYNILNDVFIFLRIKQVYILMFVSKLQVIQYT